MQGRGIDAPLAEIGQRQSGLVAAALASRPLRAVYASPLIRARQTAEAIAAPHGLKVVEQPELVEVEVGRWEGLSWPEVQREEPDLYEKFIEDPGKTHYPGGENLDEVAERIVPCFESLMERHVGQEIAIVAHSVVNRIYLGRLIGLTQAQGRQIAQENCSLNLVVWRDGKAKAITINAVGHLMVNSPAPVAADGA